MSKSSLRDCLSEPDQKADRGPAWKKEPSDRQECEYTPTPHLGARALSDGDDAVLVRVEAHAHFAHGLRVGDGRGKVAVPVQPPEEALPLVVAICRIGQAPRHQVLRLPITQLHLRGRKTARGEQERKRGVG
jgi:hypothetical protein